MLLTFSARKKTMKQISDSNFLIFEVPEDAEKPFLGEGDDERPEDGWTHRLTRADILSLRRSSPPHSLHQHGVPVSTLFQEN